MHKHALLLNYLIDFMTICRIYYVYLFFVVVYLILAFYSDVKCWIKVAFVSILMHVDCSFSALTLLVGSFDP